MRTETGVNTGTIVAMNRHAESGQKRMNLITTEEWEDIMKDFPYRVRGQAANLAAHNYDVTLVGDRLLISTCYGGQLFSKDGSCSELTPDQYEALYPQVHKDAATYDRAWSNASVIDWKQGIRRGSVMVEDGLKTLLQPVEASQI